MMKDLVQIIKDNPGCVARVDNDCWYLFDKGENKELANDMDAYENKEFNSCAYGYGLLVALAETVGMKVEGV